MSQPHEWIRAVVAPEVWVEARALRAKRDAIYGNRFPVKATDKRELGEAAEICFRRWLERQHMPHRWLKESPAGNPDFLIGESDFLLGWISVDVKARKRAADPEVHYEMQVGEAHMEVADWFFFAGFTYPTNTMIFLGAVTKEDMARKSRRLEAGESAHANYTVPGHEAIYNIIISHMEPPRPWLRERRAEL